MVNSTLIISPAASKHLLKFGLIAFLLCVVALCISKNFFFLALPFAVLIAIFPFANIRGFFWLLVASIPFSAEIPIVKGTLSLYFPDEPLMMLSLVVVFALLIYKAKVFPFWFWRDKLTLIIALQFIWLIIAVIFSQDHLVSIKFLLAKSWFLSSCFFLPVLLLRTKKDFRNLALVLLIPILLHALVAFAMHASSNFNFRMSNVVVLPFYQNHVDYGTILSMIFPIVLIAYQLSRGKKNSRIVLLLMLLFLIPALYAASARAALLGVIFGLVIAAAIRYRLANWVMPIFYAVVISLGLLLTYHYNAIHYRPNYSKTATQKTFEETITGAFTGEDMSSMERFYRWIASVRMVEDHPLVGVGPNNWYEFYKPHAITSFRTWVSDNPERSTTHNYFLLMLTEQGLPAMILYGILIYAIFAKCQRMYHTSTSRYHRKLTLGLSMLIAAAFVNNFFSELLETHKVGGLFYIAVALLIILDQRIKVEGNDTVEDKNLLA